jgi:phosphoribosylformylglycinamidine synthase
MKGLGELQDGIRKQPKRPGKVIELDLAETDPVKAKAAAEETARRLLANTVIEGFRVDIA